MNTAHRPHTAYLLAAATAMLAGCAGAPPAPSTAPPPQASVSTLGESKAAAVEVCMPRGQREYLSRLRCADGQAPTFQRAGSVGPRTAPPPPRQSESTKAYDQRARAEMAQGASDDHIVDLYKVRCDARTHDVYMDMYHCKGDPPGQAPAGFSIVTD